MQPALKSALLLKSLLSVCVVTASVCIPFAPSVCLPHLNAKLREQLCVGSLLSRQSTYVHTYTHHSLSCGASCPDCVNPLCPPHISLHPSTSTPLWWRHTHAHTHLLLSIIIIVSAGEESALLFVITGVWCEREEFQEERRGWMEKEKKGKSRLEKKKNTPVCLWHISHILP